MVSRNLYRKLQARILNMASAPRRIEAPDLTNWTDTALVDEIGKLSAVKNYASKQEKMYKEVLYARLGGKQAQPAPIKGERYEATITSAPRTALDQQRLKAELPD